MLRPVMGALIVPVLFVCAGAFAGTLDTLSGQHYTGAVIGVGDDSMQFAWQKAKDQPEAIRKGDNLDRAFEAQGDESVTMSFAMSELARVNGAPPTAFKALYSANLFYRLVQMLDRGRVQAFTGGDFLSQSKGVAIFALTLCLLMPLLMMLMGRILPGDSIGFLGGLGYSVLLLAIGLALSTGASLLTFAVPFLASNGMQYLLSGVLVVAVALVIHVATAHSFWQGLGFIAAWAISMVLGSNVAIMFLTAGLVDAAIH